MTEKKDAFIRVPKVLIEDERYATVSPESKLLYGLLWDRHRLSTENHWLDENSRVFIYYTLQSIRNVFGCGAEKATKMLRELQGVGLLFRKKQGRGKPDKLYVKEISTEYVEVLNENAENPQSKTSKTEIQECGKSERNNTEFNKTELNKTIDRYDMLLSQIKNSIEYDVLIERKDHDLVDDIIALLADVMSGTSPTIRLGGDEYSREQVMRRFRSLNYDHIEYVLDRMKEVKPTVGNIRAYLLTALYNAPATMDSYYTADARAWA